MLYSWKLLVMKSINFVKKSVVVVKQIIQVKARHECLMMWEEGWTMHGLEAIERIIKHEIVRKQFVEAIRVTKLN